MELKWDTNVIDLNNLIKISRGDRNAILKYLTQFQELIPARLELLEESLRNDNRKLIRQILHQMSPQLQFFGIPGIITPIRRLEHEYETMPLNDLKSLVKSIFNKIKSAYEEVGLVLKKNFDKP